MSEFVLSAATSDEVDEFYLDEKIDAIDVSKGQSTSFELTDEEAMNLYHFIRQCLLLENKIIITVTDEEGNLIHRH
ncbi:hypothetical protein [Loigolactobacillus coryniformis]|jgi:hypothetical protein|uniref:hypothetical protein n=1 Tax=Loigolactobacillus coryniformis TaxID=1610 RepID=UPI0002E87B88|nr:hypothetical protein [Loigolactobacillus coryniformis]MCL5458064.1 hypothetical protein [Loigolactobacillus coryniformis]DAG07265.1 MAG TPA: hypothetical protein [Caudoviricetes sp.]